MVGFAATFDNSLNARLDATQALGLPPQSQHLYCFAQCMLDVRLAMDALAESNVNSDDILQHHFQQMQAAFPQPHGGIHVFEANVGPDGLYTLQFAYQLVRAKPVVLA
jgi:hypothetical protein